MASRWSEDALGSAWPPLLAALLTFAGYRLGWLLEAGLATRVSRETQ